MTFGTLDGGPWGAAWSSGSPLILLAATAGQPPSAIAAARLDGSEATEDWQLAGDGVQLALTGEGNAAEARLDDGDPRASTSSAAFAAAHRSVIREVAIDCLGVRGARHEVDVRGVESIRGISAWCRTRTRASRSSPFVPGRGRVTTATPSRRPSSTPTPPRVVADPRLSTTYGADGAPARAGLELWLDGEEGKQYLRRAAGESLAVGTRVAEHDLELSAELFRWHSRGRDGAGVYLLARPA